jgi:hypothetical protein
MSDEGREDASVFLGWELLVREVDREGGGDGGGPCQGWSLCAVCVCWVGRVLDGGNEKWLSEDL